MHLHAEHAHDVAVSGRAWRRSVIYASIPWNCQVICFVHCHLSLDSQSLTRPAPTAGPPNGFGNEMCCYCVLSTEYES